jgi:hypothetical protein
MARQLAADTGELQPAGAQPFTDQMAVWLTARYLMAVRKLAAKNNDGEQDLKVLREFCHDVVALRRGDHSAARLKIEQERLEREREKTEEEMLEHFKRLAKNPEVRDWILKDWISPEERERQIREIYGREPETPDEVAIDGPESNPVNGQESVLIKPDQTKSNQIKPDDFDALSLRLCDFGLDFQRRSGCIDTAIRQPT